MKRFLPILILTFTTACGSPQARDRLVGYEVDKATITDVNYPKHFSVDIRTENGLVFNNTARSKHCNGARKRVKIGQTYDVVLNVYQREGRTVRRLDKRKLNNLLCP